MFLIYMKFPQFLKIFFKILKSYHYQKKGKNERATYMFDVKWDDLLLGFSTL